MEYLNTVTGCGENLQPCPAGEEFCSLDLTWNGEQPSPVEGQTTAYPGSAACCPESWQFVESSGQCIPYYLTDSCGLGFQV